MATRALSIVIPAHNEEAMIGVILRGLLADAERGELDIIVVANGCTDRTAEIARAISPDIRVVEIAESSKIAALNAGDAIAFGTPIAYVDADVRVDAAAARALAAALSDGGVPRVASPLFELDLHGCSWAVRQYFRIWLLNDYNSAGHIGSGVYAVSAAGRARWTTFPDVIADDRFVQQLFADEERVVLKEHAFSVPAPQTLRAQIRRSVRIHAGNAELRNRGIAGAEKGGQAQSLAHRVARRPRLWLAFAVYCTAYALTRFEAAAIRRSKKTVGWRRDDTTRVA